MRRLTMVLAMTLTLPVAGQEQPPKDPDPELSDPSIDRIVREMIDGSTPADSISPRTPARALPAGQFEGPLLPGLSMEGYELGAPPLLPEDTFITRRRGRLLRLSGGDWAFVFHEDPEAMTIQPMIVLPCRELERVESVIEDPAIGGVFDASGRIYVYQGRNYLLPNARHGLLPVRIEAPVEPTPDPTASVLEPEMASIVAALEAEREAHRPLTPLRAEPVDETSGMQEGTFLVRRRGRMTRLASGQWAFVMDADASDAGRDPALVVTPSGQLMDMERLASNRGEQMVLELTGTTLVYKQRVYIVPMMFKVLYEDNVRPLQ